MKYILLDLLDTALFGFVFGAGFWSVQYLVAEVAFRIF